MIEHDVDIDALFEPGQEEALQAYLRLLHPADIAELFDFIERDDWTKITRRLSAEHLADVLAELDETQRELLGEVLGTERLVEAVDELETDDAADVIGDLPDDKQAEVLGEIEDREAVERLLRYDEDSAGGIMQTELAKIHVNATVPDAIAAVRQVREWGVEDVLELYVVDDDGRLTGTVALEDLVLSQADTSMHSITSVVEQQVTPEVDQEEVAHLFGKYDLYTLPVVDHEGILLGRITYDDVQDVLEEEASEDIMAAVGASPEDLVYSGDFLKIAMFRLPWLGTSLLGSLATGFLLSLFGQYPWDAIVMASFVPVVMAMTGNVGAQSAMIVTRGFAIGRIEFGNLGRAFTREVWVGLIMGISAGVVVGFVGYLWQSNVRLGIALGIAMSSSMTIASLVGVAAPAVFKRIGIDPAIASGPLVTTGCDLLGVMIYLLVALFLLT